ncbi:MAG: membrane-bound PQQ-dependent dehydrogenase, glucose/quinate/shikimate family, partial [Comamonadaceae bacterium]
MNTHPSAQRRTGMRFFLAFLFLLGLIGLAMAVLGGWLVVLHGSPYYVLAGVMLMVAAMLMAMGRAGGVALFGALVALTLVWALYEVGLDGWALIPRLAWIAVLGLLLLAFWSVARRRMPLLRPAWLAVSAGLLPLLAGVLILVPLLRSPHIEIAAAQLSTQRPAEAFSRGTVSSPDGNVAATHDASSWTAYGGSNLSNRFAPAAQITP